MKKNHTHHEGAGLPCDGDGPPIFVIGHPRSGTTVLTSILDLHPRLSMYMESNYFKEAEPCLDFASDPADKICRRLGGLPMRFDVNGITIDQVSDDFSRREKTSRNLFLAIVGTRMRVKGKQRWGEKTPLHILDTERIVELFPDAQIIYVVRDPRYVVRSMKFADWKRTLGRLQNTVVVMSWLIDQGYGVYRGLSKDLGEKQVFKIRYEDLVAQPEIQVAGLCDFLGEAYYPSMLDVGTANSSFEKARTTNGIHRLSVGKLTGITRFEAGCVELFCGDLMLSEGYQPGLVPKGLIKLLCGIGYYWLQRRLCALSFDCYRHLFVRRRGHWEMQRRRLRRTLCPSCGRRLPFSWFWQTPAAYCRHCTNESGRLKSKEMVQRSIARWFMAWHNDHDYEKLLDMAGHYMKAMPAWSGSSQEEPEPAAIESTD